MNNIAEKDKLTRFLNSKGYGLNTDISNFKIRDAINLYFEFIEWKKIGN